VSNPATRYKPQNSYPDPAVQGHPHTAGGLAQLAYEAVRDGSPHAAELTAQAAETFAQERSR
jgi:hypothetical protein